MKPLRKHFLLKISIISIYFSEIKEFFLSMMRVWLYFPSVSFSSEGWAPAEQLVFNIKDRGKEGMKHLSLFFILCHYVTLYI